MRNPLLRVWVWRVWVQVQPQIPKRVSVPEPVIPISVYLAGFRYPCQSLPPAHWHVNTCWRFFFFCLFFAPLKFTTRLPVQTEMTTTPPPPPPYWRVNTHLQRIATIITTHAITARMTRFNTTAAVAPNLPLWQWLQGLEMHLCLKFSVYIYIYI